jgi:succinate dehydrogenase hydrophobic anchor subunit
MTRITGLLLVVLVIAHYFLMHVDADRGHTFKGVFEALTDPVWGPWLKMLDLTMLTLGIWHGLNGAWGVLRDYKLAPTWNFLVLGVLVTAGVAFGAMGFATILSF